MPKSLSRLPTILLSVAIVLWVADRTITGIVQCSALGCLPTA